MDTGHLEVDSVKAVSAHIPRGQCVLPAVPVPWLEDTSVRFLAGRRE